MFDIGFAELLVIAVVALIVIGPERLPETARTLGLWAGRLKRMFSNAKSELERELGVDEVRRQLHNEQIMSQLRELDAKPAKDPLEETEHKHGEENTAATSATENPAPEPPATNAENNDRKHPDNVNKID